MAFRGAEEVGEIGASLSKLLSTQMQASVSQIVRYINLIKCSRVAPWQIASNEGCDSKKRGVRRKMVSLISVIYLDLHRSAFARRASKQRGRLDRFGGLPALNTRARSRAVARRSILPGHCRPAISAKCRPSVGLGGSNEGRQNGRAGR